MTTFLPKKIEKVVVPPIKCQGIKTKLVGFIADSTKWNGQGRWIEPFLGSGVVLFNIAPQRALIADTNKHIIGFYKALQSGKLDEEIVKNYLVDANEKLSSGGADYFYAIRERFNESGDPLDFLFLNRSCFNGVMRFNRHGKFNVPFGKKTDRFRQAYVTKITNQVRAIRKLIENKDWEFIVSDWKDTLAQAKKGDFVYLDPPYVGRHTDYFNTWKDEDATGLSEVAAKLPCGFALSMWKENKYRKNDHLTTHWKGFDMELFSHFYHVGSKEELRNEMTEALVYRH